MRCGFLSGDNCCGDGPCEYEDYVDDYEPPAGLPRHLSPSQISTLLTCGEQYRLSRVARVANRPMWAGIGGTCVHQITEDLDREWYEDNA